MPVLLSAQLHPALAPHREDLALPAEGVLEGVELSRLTAQVAALLPLHQLARHDPQRRWWARLALTDAVEVYLLGWARGQSTGPHDHNGAHGALTVVHGSVREDLYDWDSAAHTGVRVHRTGSSAVFSPRHAHDITGATLATTVHAYSPPLRPTRPLHVPAPAVASA